MKTRCLFKALLILVLMGASAAAETLSVQELVEKNIQAAGGKEKLALIKNYSFKAAEKTYFMSAGGSMKITSGSDPVITEVIFVSMDEVKRNCFNKITEFEGLIKSTYQAMAIFRSGLFTLKNFKDQLEFVGVKSFGPKNHYFLTTQIGSLDVDFYLDPDEYLIKRVVLKGFAPEVGKYEVNQDFGPSQEIEGIKIPSSWFNSQLGVTRGSLYEVSDVTFNQALGENFFSTYEVNVGNVEIGEGKLKGNIVGFNAARGNRITISTNITEECVQGAGFKANDKLVLDVNDRQIEIDYYDSQPPRNAYSPGAKLMAPSLMNENFVVYILSEEYTDLLKSLKPLSPIQVKKKEMR